MNHSRVQLSTGTIDIFDDAVPMHKRSEVYEFLTSSCAWFIGWADLVDSEPNLHSSFDSPKAFEIIEGIQDSRMEGMVCDQVIANLSHPSSVHHKHTHPDKDLVTLYYANLKWEEHWEGETMFFAENGEVEYTNKYVPGRILLFDAKMPHCIRAQSPAGPQFRFTISYFWRRNEEMVENLGKESG